MAVAITHYKGDMLFETEVGEQRIQSDVTPAMGGKGRAPTPPDFFVVSLGSCVAAFVANYCQQKGIDATDLKVQTYFEKAEKPVSLTGFRIDIELPHADCHDRDAAIRRVAEHCIIHETLAQWKDFEIRLLDRQALADQE